MDAKLEGYLAGLEKAMACCDEQREAEGGEACCSLQQVVALDNAIYRIDLHRVAVEKSGEIPGLKEK